MHRNFIYYKYDTILLATFTLYYESFWFRYVALLMKHKAEKSARK